MSAPASYPRWATDGGTRTTPSSGAQDTGFVPATAAAAKIVNWIFNLIYQWIVYLDAQDVANVDVAKRARNYGVVAAAIFDDNHQSTVGSTTGWNGFASDGLVATHMRACGDGAALAQSFDGGKTWATNTAGSAYAGDFSEIVAMPVGGGIQWIAVGGFHGTTKSIQYAADHGTSWTQAVAPAVSCGGVAVNAAAPLCVVTLSDGVTTYTSTNGVAFTVHTVTNGPTGRIAFGAGLFVGLTATGVVTSPDGVTWTVRTPASTFTALSRITYDAVHGFAIFGAVSGGFSVDVSTNGTTWALARTGGSGFTVQHITSSPGGIVAMFRPGQAAWMFQRDALGVLATMDVPTTQVTAAGFCFAKVYGNVYTSLVGDSSSKIYTSPYFAQT